MTAPRFKLWQADPHDFGPGKSHIAIEGEDAQLFCGRARADIPGRWIPIVHGRKATCLICLRIAHKRYPTDADEIAMRERSDAAMKERGACRTCGGAPSKAKREDGAGVRGIFWCMAGGHPAFGGSSFFQASEKELAELPLVVDLPVQRSLF